MVRRGQLEILFVALEGKAQMRLVRTGKLTAQGIEILAGLAPGEHIVVSGNFLIDSESRLRASLAALSAQDTSKPQGAAADPHAGHQR